MPDIFLSYSRDDLSTARRFAEAFERDGFSVWWDQTLKPGEAYDRVTEKALQNAKAVVVLWSRNSVESHWVRSEATQAQTNGTLVPVMIEACKRPIMFELMHTAELTQWKGDTSDPVWRAFAKDVRQFVKKEELATPAAVARASIRPLKQFGLRTLISVVALLVVGAGVWLSGLSRKVEPNAVTLAVLPFADMSTARDQEAFSDGLSEEILNQMAQVRDLTVIGRTSSFAFKGKNEDLRVIGKELGASHLLEGSIRKEGTSLRITAQLINARSGAHIWSQTYPRELKDFFAVQEEIAKDVAQALSIKLDVGEMSHTQGGTTNLEAYDRFMLGQKSFDLLNANVFNAARLFREATALDPNFWRAWYGLAAALAYNVQAGGEVGAASARELATVRAHLIEAAPDSWAKQSMLAAGYIEQRKWKEYEVSSHAALAKIPATAAIDLVSVALTRMSVGHAQEAVGPLERAVKSDPLGFGPSAALQLCLEIAGRADDAQVEYERSKRFAGMQPGTDFLSLQRLMHRPGVSPAEVRAFSKSLESKYPQMTRISDVLYLQGDPQAMRAALQRLLQDPASQNPRFLGFVINLADYAGDKDIALDTMHRAAAMINSAPLAPDILNILWSPFKTGLRTDPRFKDIVRELGLVNYWRATGDWGDFCKPLGKEDFEYH